MYPLSKLITKTRKFEDTKRITIEFISFTDQNQAIKLLIDFIMDVFIDFDFEEM